MKVITLLLVVFPFVVIGQIKNDNDITDTINSVYHSDSSNFIFDLKLVPVEVTNKILNTNDSIERVISHENQKTKLKRFIANTYDNWNATDVVSNEKLPFRRFIYGINSNTKWIIFYEHGGIGSHYHLVYLNKRNYKTLTTVVTLFNSTKIDELIFNKKVKEIATKPFSNILNGNEQYKILNGELISDYDIF